MALVHLWLCLVGLVIILYVVLDGFSLGVGLLFPTAKGEEERDVLMNSIAPVWDARMRTGWPGWILLRPSATICSPGRSPCSGSEVCRSSFST